MKCAQNQFWVPFSAMDLVMATATAILHIGLGIEA